MYIYVEITPVYDWFCFLYNEISHVHMLVLNKHQNLTSSGQTSDPFQSNEIVNID